MIYEGHMCAFRQNYFITYSDSGEQGATSFICYQSISVPLLFPDTISCATSNQPPWCHPQALTTSKIPLVKAWRRRLLNRKTVRFEMSCHENLHFGILTWEFPNCKNVLFHFPASSTNYSAKFLIAFMNYVFVNYKIQL